MYIYICELICTCIVEDLELEGRGFLYIED